MLKNIMIRSGAGEPEPRLVNKAGVNTLEAVYRVAYYVGENKTHIGTGMSLAGIMMLTKLFKLTMNAYVPPLFSVYLSNCNSRITKNFKREIIKKHGIDL